MHHPRVLRVREAHCLGNLGVRESLKLSHPPDDDLLLVLVEGAERHSVTNTMIDTPERVLEGISAASADVGWCARPNVGTALSVFVVKEVMFPLCLL